MDTRVKKLVEDAERQLKRDHLLSLWQEEALNFFPEMADFTVTRTAGDEFVEHLTTSYPVLARRSLGNTLSALLRPVNLDTSSPGVWFNIRSTGAQDKQSKRWLEQATATMREKMYVRSARFVRATNEGDHMFATFGNAPLTVEVNRQTSSLLYRSWHLRDVAWTEDASQEINCAYRRWKPTAKQLVSVFGEKKVHDKVKELLDKDPHKTVQCIHIVMKSEDYDTKVKTPWVSLWVDRDNNHVLEETGSHSRIYVIPRWVTVPGNQYAMSPAVTAALPDARLIQAMTLTMLESSEKAADPPMKATVNAVRSDTNLMAGGVTWVDEEYDEKMGKAIEAVYDPRSASGMTAGLNLRADVRDEIARAFFLDSLTLPPAGEGGMSEFEVGQRISEWIRRAMPIFEPLEFEYNGAICEETFDILMRAGAFGPYRDIPEPLRGDSVQFKFESPLHESAERSKGHKFVEAQQILLSGAQTDPSVVPMLNVPNALRDIFDGIGLPADWTRDEMELQKIAEAQAQKSQQMEEMTTMQQGADVAETATRAIGNLQGKEQKAA